MGGRGEFTMRIVRLKTTVPAEEMRGILTDPDRVNRNVRFDEKSGTPKMKPTFRGDRLRVKCEMMNRPTKDNGFLVGTYFSGKLSEKDGVTTLSGIIVTEPIFHLAFFALFVYFIVLCFSVGGFSVVPIFLAVFVVVMFWKEYQKQGIIERYLSRAFRRAEEGAKKE